MSLRTVWKPEAFQGTLKGRRYFEGWYYRVTSADSKRAFVFIPGVSLAPDPSDSHSFIQYIDGQTGRSGYVRYALEEFRPEPGRLDVRVGASRFRLDRVELDLQDGDFSVRGTLGLSGIHGWPVRFLAPGCMGPFRFVPGLECLHGIVSFDHDLSGSLSVNGRDLDFDSGRGYIEKDWGHSMPRAWIWLQTNNFGKRRACLTVSIANVPWLGSSFTGMVAALWFDNRLHPFTTWNRSRLSRLETGERLRVRIENRGEALELEAETPPGAELASPESGAMSGRIRETLDAEVRVRLLGRDGSCLFEGTGTRAGLETVGDTGSLAPRR